MLKKIAISSAILVLSFGSYALGYVMGGSNMGGFYPPFSSYLSFDPSYEEMGRYMDEGKEYVENCNADIQRIVVERDNAITEINNEIERFKMNHY